MSDSDGSEPEVVAAPAPREDGPSQNEDNLTQEQVEKLVQLQDLTGIDDTAVCRALLESNGWDLEATAREQFGEQRQPQPPPPQLRPHDEAPEIRQRLFGAEPPLPAAGVVRRPPPPPPVRPNNDGPLASILSWGVYMVTLPVVWPVRLLYNVVWSLASMVGILPAGRSIAAPSSSQAPIEDVRSFRRSFADSYGGDHLHFHDGTYSQALETAKRELKFLVVYLHSPGHQDADRFCRQTLCSPQFTEFLQDKVLFGASVETNEGFRVSQAVRVRSYPLLAVIVLRQNRMMIVGRQEGFLGPDALVARFTAVVADNEAFVVAARADRAERDMNQAIRAEQDAAFQETLRQDREKDRLKREAEEERQRLEAAAEAAVRSAADRKDKIRAAKTDMASRVPPEPDSTETEDVARIVIKLPGGGRLPERKFRRHTDTLADVFLYVFCHPDSPDEFDVTTNFPRKVLPCKPAGFFRSIGVDDSSEDQEDVENDESKKTLAEAGIGKSEMLFVNDLEA